MGNLLKSFFFKLSKDIVFRVIMFVGIGLAIFSAGLLALLDLFAADLVDGAEVGMKFCSGPSMLLLSLSPAQNFGIIVPICVVIFVASEFTQGTIRNKIIGGYSKTYIFCSLFLSGLILAGILVGIYVGTSTLLGLIFGGFDLSKPVFMLNLVSVAPVDGKYLGFSILLNLLAYVSLISFALFLATAFRSVGPCIPIIILTIIFLPVVVQIFQAIDAVTDSETFTTVMKYINPLYAATSGTKTITQVYFADGGVYERVVGVEYPTDTLIAGIVNNLAYSGIFFGFGCWMFSARDVK